MEIEDPTIQSFLAQFERNGADYLYRSPAALNPIRVTAAERQAFLDDYARRVPSLIWILLGGILASTLFMLADISILHVPHGLYIDIAAFAAAFFGWAYASQYFTGAPERALRERIPPGETLGWLARHKRMLATKSWRKIAADGGYFVFWLLWLTSGQIHSPAVHAFALASGAVFLVLFALNVALKLRLSAGSKLSAGH